MPTVHGNISTIHAAAMSLPLSDIRQRIRDIEERAAVASLAKAGKHDAVRRMVGLAETAVRDRLNERMGRLWA